MAMKEKLQAFFDELTDPSAAAAASAGASAAPDDVA